MKDKGEICGISPVVAVEVILFLMNQGVKQRLHRLVIIFGPLIGCSPERSRDMGRSERLLQLLLVCCCRQRTEEMKDLAILIRYYFYYSYFDVSCPTSRYQLPIRPICCIKSNMGLEIGQLLVQVCPGNYTPSLLCI